MKKIFCAVLAAVMTMMGVCGCDMNKTDKPNTPETVVLTPRQEEILQSQELPTRYEELNATQKAAIVAIEELLQYAESKYEIALSFGSYTAADGNDPEQLYAWPVGGDRETDGFTVERTDEGCRDNYIQAATRQMYSDYVGAAAAELLGDTAGKTYAQVVETGLTAVPEKAEAFDNDAYINAFVFVDGTACGEEETKAFAQALTGWMREHGLQGMAEVVLLKPDVLKYLTAYNYVDYMAPEQVLYRDRFYVDE